MHLNQGSANFFREGLDSKYLDFVRLRVSVSTTQLCAWNWKAADNKFLNGCSYVPITQNKQPPDLDEPTDWYTKSWILSSWPRPQCHLATKCCLIRGLGNHHVFRTVSWQKNFLSTYKVVVTF